MVAFQFGAVLAVGLLAISRPRTRAIYPATGDDALSMFPAARPRSRSRRACVCVCLSLSLCGSRLGVARAETPEFVRTRLLPGSRCESAVPACGSRYAALSPLREAPLV